MDQANLKITGAPSLDEIKQAGLYLDEEVLAQGAKACIECVEEIPCNPCEGSCPHQAITIGEDITNIPKLDVAKCIGCGLCISACPCLCITVKGIVADKAVIQFPFEYLPLPSVADTVDLINRFGEIVCQGTVTQVNTAKRNRQTAVIRVEYPSEYLHQVVNMQRL